MADFKIKPAAGTGNKLILESEDGTDVLTTSASGVTLASATLTSPTLNSPTLVTPALGTVATGNLANTAIVYPAGHVTKVHVHPLASDVNCTGSGYSTYQTVVISPSSGTSKLYVSHTMHSSQGTGGSASFQQQLAFSGSNVTDGTYTTSESYQYLAASAWRVRSFMYQEVVLDGTASDVTFLLKVYHSHVNNTTYVIGNNINETSVTVIEVY